MQFTEEDEEKLCEWIAAKIPYKEIGGRTGNRLYQQLCDLVSPLFPSPSSLICFQSAESEYAWVSRHTWQSWRERYKKNAERLDKVIAGIVEEKMPQRGEKGQYGYVRKAEEKPKKGRKKKTKAVDDLPTAEECPNDIVNVLGVPAAGPNHSHTSGIGIPPLHPTITSLHDLTTMGNHYAGVTAPSAPAGNSSVTATAAEEELEDDGTEWAVRIGNAPPPLWSSKKRERDQDQVDDFNKRRRLEKFVHLFLGSHFFPSIDVLSHIVEQQRLYPPHSLMNHHPPS